MWISRLSRLVLWALVVGLINCQSAEADRPKLRHGLDVVVSLAEGIEIDRSDMARIEVQPELEVRFGSGWRADLALRLEASGASVGLGSEETFSDVSRPLSLGPDARIEIEEATLSWRKRSTRLVFGKQTLAWGVLDGLQVTDRFDATRRREAVFIDQRPDRISRWGARAEFKAAGLRWDVAALLDGTVDQLAAPGDTYAASAPRFRAGLPPSAPLPDLSVRTPSDPTLGLRVSRRSGASDASLLIIRGPDTEPVFTGDLGRVSLEYETRTLLGATWQRSAGARVWRVETAWIPDQPVNVQATGLQTETTGRWLAGVGLDWDLPDSAFLNAQIGVDRISGESLVRPQTDVIATVKAQRSMRNGTVNLSAEMIGSLREGDGTFRPAISWQVRDSLRLQAGLDLVWGDSSGLFGQFRDTDRVWVKLSCSI